MVADVIPSIVKITPTRKLRTLFYFVSSQFSTVELQIEKFDKTINAIPLSLKELYFFALRKNVKKFVDLC